VRRRKRVGRRVRFGWSYTIDRAGKRMLIAQAARRLSPGEASAIGQVLASHYKRHVALHRGRALVTHVGYPVARAVNPTMVHHGLIPRAAYHLWIPYANIPGGAVAIADVYVSNAAAADAVAQAMADYIGVSVMVSKNDRIESGPRKGLMRRWAQHRHEGRAVKPRARNRGRRKKRNPAPRSIARKSVRSITRGGRRMLVGCPAGQYRPRRRGRKKCATAMRRVNRKRRRKRNPGGAMHSARKTFKKWHGFESHRTIAVKGPDRTIPPVLVQLGKMDRIDYVSNKYGGRAKPYTHKTGHPAPILATDPAGKHLFIVGGNVRVTADGLVG
jgi:hypothetical protein